MENSGAKTELSKIPLTFKETRSNGGGAQIEFLPFTDEDIGMRVYKDTIFPNQDSAEARVRAEASSSQLRWLLAESILSLNLPEGYQPVTPKLLALGLFVPEKEGSFYFEVDPKKMQGEGVFDVLDYLYAEGCELTKGGVKPKLFSLVEKVPIAQWKETDPSRYHSPKDLVEVDHEAYRKGLVAGLKFYQECMRFGFWNFDIKDKDPFLCNRNGEIKVIDTSGFQTLKEGRADVLMQKFYEKVITGQEKAVFQELKQIAQNPLKPDEQVEYEQLSTGVNDLRQEGQNLLTSLGIEDQVDRYENVEERLVSKERDFEWAKNKRERLSKTLEELRSKMAEAERQKSVKIQAEEIDRKIQKTEKNLYKAQNGQERVMAIQELRIIAKQIVESSKETVDSKTWDRLYKLRLASEIQKDHSHTGNLYCQDVLNEISAMDEEKPLEERLTVAREQLENVQSEITALKEQRASLGKIPEFIWGPFDYEFTEAENDLAQIRTDSETDVDKRSLARIRKIIDSIKIFSSLDFKIKYAEKETMQKAKNTTKYIRMTCFEDELPKHTGKQVGLSEVASLLKEIGFEKFLEWEDNEKLRDFYNLIKSGQYGIKEAQTVLDIFVNQVERM